MFGHQEGSMATYLIGLLFLIFCLFAPVPSLVLVFIVIGIVFSLFAFIWINYVVSHNRLQPLINRVSPVNEVVWVRVTKNKLLTFQVAKKGAYGQTMGRMHGEKADVVDKGDFPIRLINGNSALLVNDMSSQNVNPTQAIAWKKLMEQENVDSGKQAYLKNKDEKKKRIKFNPHPKRGE